MMRLEINHTWGQIGIQTTPSRLELKSPGYTLDIQTTLPRVKVEGTLPKVQIDQSRCFAESGLKKPLELTAENAQKAIAAMQSSIARIAEQGNELADVVNNPDAIANQGYSNAFEQFDADYNMVTMPKSRPTITLIEGKLDIKIQKATFQNNTPIKRMDMQYVLGAVSIYMKQMNRLDVQFIDTKV